MRRVWMTAAATTLTVPALVALTGGGATAGVTATCDGETVTIPGTDGNDSLTGTPARDVIAAMAGDDTISALGGNDLICGGRGIDTIDAGAGADTVYGGADGRSHGIEGDLIEGGPGDDELHGGLASDESGGSLKYEDVVVYRHAPRGVHVTLAPGVTTATGQGTDTIDGFNSVFGGKHADTITAGAETDLVRGFGGADVMKIDSNEGEVLGGDGDDVIRLGKSVNGGKGDDTIINARATSAGGPGDDLMLGRPHRDVLFGGPGDDVLRGRGGGDALIGSQFQHNEANRLVGGDGPDTLVGGEGADRLLGGHGDDELTPGDYVPQKGHRKHVADDVVHGGSGTDTVLYLRTYRSGGVRVDLRAGVATRVGHDSLAGVENAVGGHRGDDLLGDGRRNVLTGNGGDDHLVGRGRTDTADGAKGTDTCDAEKVVDCEIVPTG